MAQIDIPDFDKLISGNGTPGNMGDTGAIYTAKINGNFALIKVTEQQIDAILTEIAAKMLTFITAGAIKSLNVTTSGILQYSTDGVSYIDCIQWGKIRGSITNQSDLRTLLDEKASTITVAALESLITGLRADVNTNTENIASNLAKIEDNTSDITEINVDLTTINNQLALRPLGNGIRQFRISGGRLQYSLSDPATPNPTWVTVTADVTVTWQMLTGDPLDNEDLAALFIEKADQEDLEALQTQLQLLTPRVTTLEGLIGNTNVQQIEQDLASHIANHNNPHQVDKSDLNLENVDNTSDMNKPVSTAQAAAILAAQQAGEAAAQAVQSEVNSHVIDTNNPHQVTKAQVGLDKVNNTSDLEKPISTETRAALSAKVSGTKGAALQIVNQAQYDALVTKKDKTVYVISEDITAEDMSYSNLTVTYAGVEYATQFEITDSSVREILLINPCGYDFPWHLKYNGGDSIPTSGEVVITAFLDTNNPFYNASSFTVGKVILE